MSPSKAKRIPRVVIAGRANVGKSTLWNRLIERSQALVSDKPHTTRDINWATCLWRGREILVADSGGMDVSTTDEIEAGIARQAEQVIEDADLVLFLIDSKSGVLPQDIQLAAKVRRLNPEVLLVANKSDHVRDTGEALGEEAWKLQMGEAVPISAASGRGVGDLLDHIYDALKRLRRPPIDPTEEKPLRITLMGRPNVGKSSLINAILNEERVIVSAIPHTTREPLDTELIWNDKKLILVDTAGMRRRSRVSGRLEHESIERNQQALSRADIAVLVIDATEDPSKQDKHLAGMLQDSKKGLIVVVNKWDLIQDKTPTTTDKFISDVRDALPFLTWAPVLFTSAHKKQRVRDILKLAFRIQEERNRHISDNALSRFFKQIIAKQSPRAASGSKAPYITTVTQTNVDPPRFSLTVQGTKIRVQAAWIRFFENQLREKFGFTGTPIVIDLNYEVGAPPTPAKPRRKRPIGRKGFRY